MHPCGEMKDRAHKAGTLALTSAPPLQTSFNLWEADKFLSVFLAQPPQTPYSSRLKTVRSRLPLTTRQRGKHVVNDGLAVLQQAAVWCSFAAQRLLHSGHVDVDRRLLCGRWGGRADGCGIK